MFAGYSPRTQNGVHGLYIVGVMMKPSRRAFRRRRPSPTGSDTCWGRAGALVNRRGSRPQMWRCSGFLTGLSPPPPHRELEAIILDNLMSATRELADLYLDEGKFARARELYDKVISPRADSLHPVYRRGLAASALEDFPAAVTDLERVVARDPKYDFHRAIGLLAHALSRAGHPERAEELFKAATNISTLSETYCNYASFLASRQRPSEAREWAQKVLAKKPTMPGYLRRRERPWFRKAKASSSNCLHDK